MSGSWRDVVSIHPAADLFPMMTADELKALGEDIKKNGLIIPVVFWKDQKHFDPVLIDGRNRLDAMEAAGISISVENVATGGGPDIDLYMRTGPNEMAFGIRHTTIRGDQCGHDPSGYVIGANVHRRHLTAEQRRDLIAKVLKATPGKSNRQIAGQVKADDKTVGKVRRELEATAEIPQLQTRAGKDGKSRPATVDEAQPGKPVTMAQMGEKVSMVPTESFKRATHLIGAVERFAEFCRSNSAVSVAAGVLPHERDAVVTALATIDAWLARFAVALDKTGAAAAPPTIPEQPSAAITDMPDIPTCLDRRKATAVG